MRCVRNSNDLPNGSVPRGSSRTSTAKAIRSERCAAVRRKSSSGRPLNSCIASRMSVCARRETNLIASNRLDLPDAFGPTTAVNGRKSSVKFSKVLKPSISMRVITVNPPGPSTESSGLPAARTQM